MPTVQKVQEERHSLCLCAGVFESPYPANFTRFFLWFLAGFPLISYIPQSYSYYRHVKY